MMEERTFVSKVKENFTFFGTMSLLYGILFTFCMYQNPNGITFPILVFFTNGFALEYVKKIGFHVQKNTWIYSTGMLLLGISSFLTSNRFFIFFNGIGIFLLFLVMMMHQFYQDKEWNFQIYSKNIMLLIKTTITSVTCPFQHAAQHFVGNSSKKRKTASYILLGAGIAILLLIMIFPLLIHSDRIFEFYFGKFITHIHLGDAFWIGMMIIIMAVLSYAFFCALCKYSLKTMNEEKQTSYNPIIAITFTSVLAIIYSVYSVIQIIYLFIGRGKRLPEGITYSAYARSGFWELLFVSSLNFILILICMRLFEENRMLKNILLIISACTFIMIFSAAYRMCMYIDVYHLTFLRILVLWFLFLLALIMGGTIYSIYRKKFSLFRYVMVVTACCYITFSLAKPDYWIAKYNLSQIQKNQEQQIINWEDLNYFIYSLSLDAVPALATIDAEQMLADDENKKIVLEEYFTRIKNADINSSIREFNYSHWQAIKAVEKYDCK